VTPHTVAASQSPTAAKERQPPFNFSSDLHLLGRWSTERAH